MVNTRFAARHRCLFGERRAFLGGSPAVGRRHGRKCPKMRQNSALLADERDLAAADPARRAGKVG
jgi:hypothetical protein